MHRIFIAAMIGMTMATAALPDAAGARTRSRGVGVQASDGCGYVRQRAVTRQPGYRAAGRSTAITADGAGGYTVATGRTRADGSTTTRSTTVDRD